MAHLKNPEVLYSDDGPWVTLRGLTVSGSDLTVEMAKLRGGPPLQYKHACDSTEGYQQREATTSKNVWCAGVCIYYIVTMRLVWFQILIEIYMNF